MSVSKSDQAAAKPSEHKSQSYFVGSLLGLAVGFLAAYFYVRAAEESDNAEGLKATDFVKIGLALLGLVRQITEMGSKQK